MSEKDLTEYSIHNNKSAYTHVDGMCLKDQRPPI